MIKGLTKKDILSDYRLAIESRQASLQGRKEVFMGKAKFGIFGDGKEVPQLAMARVFKNGDFRSGYYRDQTFMSAIGQLTLEAFFAQLFAHADICADPSSAGRCMNSHFATRSLDEKGEWKDLMSMKNSSADVSCTASQMPRLVGLAYASKLYRENNLLKDFKQFSNKGNEIAFGTIGNASCAEGLFWESINAAGVLKVPMLMSIWDDNYGISVPNHYQITKGNISEVLSGFQKDAGDVGFEIFKVKGWDYPSLYKTYNDAEKLCRKKHIPVIVHVIELTQPQGHSTSGSHERYKSKERLEWEKEHDCIAKMKSWILSEGIAKENELDKLEKEAIDKVKEARKKAWSEFSKSFEDERKTVVNIIGSLLEKKDNEELRTLKTTLSKQLASTRLDIMKTARKALVASRNYCEDSFELREWVKKANERNFEIYSSHLYSQSQFSALSIEETLPEYNKDEVVDGREIMQACFSKILDRDPRVFAIGEDVGKIGDVNQGFAGLQKQFGELRVTDTGIREATILGQGIGAAMRGLRPIVEIQYLDYIFYALQIMSDDLATLQYRTKGGQKAPVIIRTRGHRLEGIWHSGSPIGTILNCIRGIYFIVPRNMTQAAGFYNTMLKSDDSALIIECLNGYRLKEKMPSNLEEFTVPLGQPEVLKNGNDITVVTYGSMCRVVMEAAERLTDIGIDIEVIDVQTLLPFDLSNTIIESLKKTNRIIFADEDVSGGATAYMLAKVLDEKNGYKYLDSKPLCVTAKDHRPAYADDGDYFSKPNAEDIFDACYQTMSEVEPSQFPSYL